MMAFEAVPYKVWLKELKFTILQKGRLKKCKGQKAPLPCRGRSIFTQCCLIIGAINMPTGFRKVT